MSEGGREGREGRREGREGREGWSGHSKKKSPTVLRELVKGSQNANQAVKVATTWMTSCVSRRGGFMKWSPK